MKWALLALVILLIGFVAFQWLTFPDVAALASSAPEETAFMKQRRAQLRAEGKSDALEQQWVSYSRISPYLRRAVLVAEDDEFYQHEGVDVEGLKEALRKDWENKRLTHGGSTITQQLAKNLYLSPSRNPFRKLKEFLIARRLEDKLSKKRILEIYLNVVEFGERVYGAEAAARHHFGKSASSLTPSEAALLAGSLPNPRVMVASKPNKRLRSRQRMILSRMRRWGYLFEKEVLTANPPTEIPTATPPPPDPDLTPPETETVEPELPETTTTTEPPEPLPEPPPPLPTETMVLSTEGILRSAQNDKVMS